jgi:class 3 adenylate cyclase/CheY-like chemotaxis protein
MDLNLKHELRTPLNHIIGYCELMLEEAADRDGDRLIQDLRSIHRSGKRLLAMVNDLLEASRQPADRARANDDIRTMLRDIIGNVEMLQQELATAPAPDLLEDLGKIGSAARELLRLVVEHLLRDDGVTAVASPRDVSTFVRRGGPSSDTESAPTGALLVVDDDEGNREILARRLLRLGYHVTTAVNGRDALDELGRSPFDLLLLDIEMPVMNGYQVLETLQADALLRLVPVIVLSASDDAPGVARCIEMGAEDYLPKPFDPALLQARLTACLEKKRLRDREQMHLRQIHAEQDRAERLLLNILPPAIAERLKQGEEVIADDFADATVLFGDLVGFAASAAETPAAEVVSRLNDIFSAFDQAVVELGLEKIKTIGDAYMAVGGVPLPRPDHAEAVAELALRMLEEVALYNARAGRAVQVRIGVDVGPVVAGIIGRHKYAYDLWGNAVNVASRMESQSLPGRIQVTAAVERRLRGRYRFEPRGAIALKGIGEMSTFFLVGRSE